MSSSRAIRSLPETVTPGERSTTARRCTAIHGRGDRPRATNTAPKTLRAGQTQPGTGEKPRRADLHIRDFLTPSPHIRLGLGASELGGDTFLCLRAAPREPLEQTVPGRPAQGDREGEEGKSKWAPCRPPGPQTETLLSDFLSP